MTNIRNYLPGSFCLLVLVGLSTTTQANPANKQAFVRHFGDFLADNLNTCVTCHVGAHAEGAASLDEFPHNPFGDQLRAEANKMYAEDLEVDISTRLMRIADQDADGDGFSNLQEILAGSAPGNADQVPSEAALQNYQDLLADYKDYQSRYQWEPFKPVIRPAVPELAETDWARNPIDHFVAAQQQKRNLQRAEEADPVLLLRRVYLDLIGLNPTPAEIRAFLEDRKTNERAYEDVIDQLLGNSAYGERWGRHWMDVWRYSDWAGYKDALRVSQRHIWHWRDWIVESLNEGKTYDQMVLDMLAADELKPDDWETLRATGFLARSYHAERDQWMDDVVKHTSQAFLGVTLGCAKCHDHMYDPIGQEDYYEFRAIFESYHVRTDRVAGVLDTMKNGIPRAYDRSLTAQTYLFEAGDERRPVKDEVIPPDVPDFLGGEYQVEPVSLPHLASRPAQRDSVKQDLLNQAEARIQNSKVEEQKQAAITARQVLEAQFAIEQLEADGQKGKEPWTQAAQELVQLQRRAAIDQARWQVKSAQLEQQKQQTQLEKAKAEEKQSDVTKIEKQLKKTAQDLKKVEEQLAKAEKAAEAEVTTKYTPRSQPSYPNKSTGRRLALARWLVDPQNPLTARVAMNHIWLRHFGTPIVPTVNEFGGNGRGPTHPALLDWLAAEFMARDWSMKQMHRLIVTSSTYRLAGTGPAENAEIDPDNLFLWKKSPRRMEGEIVRDNLLHIPGRLAPTMGGPDIDNTKAQVSQRRSIYLRHAHEKLVEFVQIFDGPSVSECYKRETSVQPHQALALVNSPLTFEAAKALAAKLDEQTAGDPQAFIDEAFLHILSRYPNPQEEQICRDFLFANVVAESSPTRKRYEKLLTVLFNHNDFVTIR